MTKAEVHDKDFEKLLEEFMPPDIKGVIKEKESGELNEEQRSQKILSQYPAVQDELDLHNLIGEEAKRVIRFFIERSHRNRLKTVRIITGKGIHSEEGRSVLRSITEDRIAELKKQGLVLSFKWEQGKIAKSGAMIVYLN